MTIAEGLTRALVRAGIPIIGVSIVSEPNRGSWVIQFGPSATAQHRIDGEAIRLTYDVTNDPAAANEDADQQIDGQRMLKAFALWTADRLSVPRATMRAQVIAIYKGLN